MQSVVWVDSKLWLRMTLNEYIVSEISQSNKSTSQNAINEAAQKSHLQVLERIQEQNGGMPDKCSANDGCYLEAIKRIREERKLLFFDE